MIKLPVDSYLPAITAHLRESNNLILQASPGSGKSTRVPPALLPVIKGKIIVLQPRRIAARMVAQRIADERQEKLGDLVGYRVRFEQSVSAQTRLEFLTEGLFIKQLQSNPLLTGIGCVVLDEFHERHVHTDTALSIVRHLQLSARTDLRLVLMSATLPGAQLKTYLPDAATISVETPMHPVQINFAPEESPLTATLQLLKDSRGHVLVFLPGAREIHELFNQLEPRQNQEKFKLFILHGSMSLSEQKLAFTETNFRKVILATNIAETSITIDGVTGVVDTGTAKISGFAPWSGLPTLSLRPISEAACIQRAGRAGRTGPGVVRRLYSALDLARRPPFEAPEIHRTDLTPLALELKQMQMAWKKAGHPLQELPWFEKPDAKKWQAAESLLTLLGALDSEKNLTPLGEAMAQLPLHPRLSRIVLAGKERNCVSGAMLAALSLSENLLVESDFFLHLENLRSEYRQGRGRIYLMMEQLARTLDVTKEECLAPWDEDQLKICLLKGFGDRVQPAAPFMLVLDAKEDSYAKGEKVKVRLSVPLTAEMLWEGAEAFLTETSETIWDTTRAKVRKFSRIRYDGHLLEEQQLSPTPEEAFSVLEKALRENWPKPFADIQDLVQMRGRLAFLKKHGIKTEMPDLTSDLPDILATTLCTGKTSFAEILEQDLAAYLDQILSPTLSAQLRELAPTHCQLHAKRRVMIHYELEKAPWIESRIQDFFGMQQTPKIFKTQVPLVVHLLAPNGRAEQVTDDLLGFWKNIYPKLRTSLGRRYPRHKWPENPV